MLRDIFRRVQRKLMPPNETIEGYERAELVETIFQKTKAYEAQGDWPLMDGVSTVLDFGGGCGLHYKLACRQSPSIKWAVVETPAMVARASELSTDRLRFFTDISDAAAWLGSVEIMHSNGALQYTPDPLDTLSELCALRAQTMVWERALLSRTELEKDVQISFLGDNGPGSIPVAKERLVKYSRTRIPEATFLDAHREYELTERGDDWFRFALR